MSAQETRLCREESGADEARPSEAPMFLLAAPAAPIAPDATPAHSAAFCKAITRLVDDATPFTAEQRERLAVILSARPESAAARPGRRQRSLTGRLAETGRVC